MSAGNQQQDAELRAHSADASVLVIGTIESLTPDDSDGMHDLFVTRGGVTSKLTGDSPVDTPCWSIAGSYRVTLAATNTARLTLRLSGKVPGSTR